MTSVNRRRAALTLHALAATDREWLLRQMGPAHQQALRGHLDELDGLGIVADAALVDAALERGPIASEPPVATQDQERINADAAPWQELAALPAAALIASLRSEPASLIARVLAKRSWPWHARMLDGLPAEIRLEVELQLESGPVSGEALDRCLLDALLERARCDPMNAPVTSAIDQPHRGGLSWFSRWRGRR